MSQVPPDPDEPEGVYATLRPLLISIAYEMAGAVGEAEDIVQEAFLRFHRAGEAGTAIQSPRAWLSTVVTRLAIDHVRSARGSRAARERSPRPRWYDVLLRVASSLATVLALDARLSVEDLDPAVHRVGEDRR